jgi:SagB-type dehydrogenase family enzyme
LGITGIAPEGWDEVAPGVFVQRAADEGAPQLVQQRIGGFTLEELVSLALAQAGIEGPPAHRGTIESADLAWEWYRGEAAGAERKGADIALAPRGNWIYLVVLVAADQAIHDLHDSVFVPAVKALAPASGDEAYARQVEAHLDTYHALLRANRDALRNGPWPDFATQSAQERGLPMPPPQQPVGAEAETIDLPPPDPDLLVKRDLYQCIADRRSRRKYTDEPLTLQELGYLLWATQGVREAIAGGKISRRTVPSSGGRHPFETYLAVERVQGLDRGVYRYLPLEHRLVYVFADETLADRLSVLAMDQPFVGRGAVCFIWSAVPYREEWRYGTQAAKGILLDAGHICQNLYLACESIGCGTCAIAAYRQHDLDQFLGLDGEEELVVYLAPVGKVETA